MISILFGIIVFLLLIQNKNDPSILLLQECFLQNVCMKPSICYFRKGSCEDKTLANVTELKYNH